MSREDDRKIESARRLAALARDLDLFVGALLVVTATIVSRLPDPTLGIIGMMMISAAVIGGLGDERLEALWRAYTAPPPPPPRRVNSEDYRPRTHARRPFTGRPEGLAPARLISDRHMTRGR